MGKNPAFQFYPGDWMKDPQLSLCTPATRGVWIDLLCAMHELKQLGELRGTVEQLARLSRCLPSELSNALTELHATGAADVEERLGFVLVMSRRMKRDAKERERWRCSKENKRVPEMSRDCPGLSTPSATNTAQRVPEDWVKYAESEANRVGARNRSAYAAKIIESCKANGGPPRNAKVLGGGPAIPEAKERSPDDFCESCEAFIGAGSREITVSLSTGEKNNPVCRHCGAALAIKGAS